MNGLEVTKVEFPSWDLPTHSLCNAFSFDATEFCGVANSKLSAENSVIRGVEVDRIAHSAVSGTGSFFALASR